MLENMKDKKISSWMISLAGAGVIAMLPQLSLADTDPLSEPLCAIADWFSGDTGKAIATIAIIFLGIAAFFGKVTWGLALMFAVGVFAIFGASDIVGVINDDGAGGCSAAA
jgi:type IV secretory pathway VirB2 component (pilin)